MGNLKQKLKDTINKIDEIINQQKKEILEEFGEDVVLVVCEDKKSGLEPDSDIKGEYFRFFLLVNGDNIDLVEKLEKEII